MSYSMIRDERVGRRNIGFGNQDNKEINQMITKDDYITYGVPEEFMGRVSSFIELNDIPFLNPIIPVVLLKQSENWFDSYFALGQLVAFVLYLFDYKLGFA